MSIPGRREVVVEIERVKIVRRRAATTIRWCPECRSTTDFIPLLNAAALFAIDSTKLFEFATRNGCHVSTETGDEILICLSDLLEAMKRKIDGKVSVLGD